MESAFGFVSGRNGDMSVTLSGAGSAASLQSMSGTVTIQSAGSKNAITTGVRQTKKTTKKQLNYNHKEISGQILRAKKAQNAGNVLSRAKSKVAMLKRCAASGDYDSREVELALAHAKRMVNCAELKLRNLKAEEQENAKHKKEDAAEEQKQRNEVKRRTGEKERELAQKVQSEEMQKVQQEKQKRQQMVQKRRMHRNNEQSKVNEADMKYIKGYTDSYYGNTSSYYDSTSGVVLQLSTETAQLNEAQLEAEIEQQVEMEVAQELAVQTNIDMAVTGGSVPSGAESTAGAGVGGAVDVAL
jgi:hypothetical protein